LAPASPARTLRLQRRFSFGFTLVELLAVIAIIAILAGLVLASVMKSQQGVYKANTQLEIGNIVTAIHDYEAAYNRLPLSREVLGSAVSKAEDFTYGTTGLSGFKDSAGNSQQIVARDSSGTALSEQRNNSELIAILMDFEKFGANPTRNANHVLNTQRTTFLNAKIVTDIDSPGVGPDGVYRDHWKHPYIITLDANGDGKTRDALYNDAGVSADQTDPALQLKRGLNGLIPKAVGATTVYEASTPVMVWSAGPDGLIDVAKPANTPANKDNVISWGP
jgi:prepilin-type N-terminal cleavage/methylation domain-containing protein